VTRLAYPPDRTYKILRVWPSAHVIANSFSQTAAAADIQLSQDILCKIDQIMQDAVLTGEPSPEGM
jgi:hypothetical protein